MLQALGVCRGIQPPGQCPVTSHAHQWACQSRARLHCRAAPAHTADVVSSPSLKPQPLQQQLKQEETAFDVGTQQLQERLASHAAAGPSSLPSVQQGRALPAHIVNGKRAAKHAAGLQAAVLQWDPALQLQQSVANLSPVTGDGHIHSGVPNGQAPAPAAVPPGHAAAAAAFKPTATAAAPTASPATAQAAAATTASAAAAGPSAAHRTGPSDQAPGEQSAAAASNQAAVSNAQLPATSSAQPPTPATSGEGISSDTDTEPLSHITWRVMAAGSWQEVRQQLDEHEGSCNHIHVTAMLQQLAKHRGQLVGAPRRDQQEFAELVGVLMRHAETLLPLMTARELPQLLAAAASLGAPRNKAWTVAAMVRVRKVLGSFTPEGLALVLWALGRLGVRLRRGRADYADQVLWAMEAKLPDCCAHSLSLCMYGLARLRCVPNEAWMAAWTGAAAQKMGEANSRDVAGMLWALAKLRSRPPDNWLALASMRLAGLAPSAVDRELATGMWGLAKMGYAPPQVALQRILAVSRLGMPHMGPKAQVTLLYALALLRCTPPAAWEAAFLERAQQQLPAFDARGLATLLYALALLRRRPSEGWMAAFWSQLEASAGEVDPLGWDMVGTACNLLGCRVPFAGGIVTDAARQRPAQQQEQREQRRPQHWRQRRQQQQQQPQWSQGQQEWQGQQGPYDPHLPQQQQQQQYNDHHHQQQRQRQQQQQQQLITPAIVARPRPMPVLKPLRKGRDLY